MMLAIAESAHPEDDLPADFRDAWLDSAAAVDYLAGLGVKRTRGTLAKWRSTGRYGPPVSYANGKPRYWRRTLHVWAMAELSKVRASPTRRE